MVEYQTLGGVTNLYVDGALVGGVRRKKLDHLKPRLPGYHGVKLKEWKNGDPTPVVNLHIAEMTKMYKRTPSLVKPQNSKSAE